MRAVVGAAGGEREQREDLVGGAGGDGACAPRVAAPTSAAASVAYGVAMKPSRNKRVAHDAVRRDGEVAEVVVADHAEPREHVEDPEQLGAKQAAAERGVERGERFGGGAATVELAASSGTSAQRRAASDASISARASTCAGRFSGTVPW